MIQARVQDPIPERIGGAVIAALDQFGDLLLQGVILTILSSRTRVRILPL